VLFLPVSSNISLNPSVAQAHWKWYHWRAWVWFPIRNSITTIGVSLAVLSKHTNDRDRQTPRQTSRDGLGCAYRLMCSNAWQNWLSVRPTMSSAGNTIVTNNKNKKIMLKQRWKIMVLGSTWKSLCSWWSCRMRGLREFQTEGPETQNAVSVS